MSMIEVKKENNKKLNILTDIISNIHKKLIQTKKEDNENVLKTLEAAREEWKNAEEYFQNVTDPDLIDYAIYRMETAKRKYFYLLKQIREEEINIEN